MVQADKPIVTITGITGYVGAVTTKMFLEDGSFRVRGTVRSKNSEAKLAPVREAFGEHFANLELVEADLLNEASLISAIQGSTFVVHIASPMSGDMIAPAVNGTKSVMKAC